MVDSIDHVVLTSSDLKKTVEFYKNVLEMEMKEDFVEEDNSLRYSLHFGNQKINIHEVNNIFFPHAKNVKSGTLDICFISKKKVSYWQNKLLKNNINLIEGPLERSGATSKIISIYCHDPDGNLIEISNLLKNND